MDDLSSCLSVGSGVTFSAMNPEAGGSRFERTAGSLLAVRCALSAQLSPAGSLARFSHYSDKAIVGFPTREIGPVRPVRRETVSSLKQTVLRG